MQTLVTLIDGLELKHDGDNLLEVYKNVVPPVAGTFIIHNKIHYRVDHALFDYKEAPEFTKEEPVYITWVWVYLRQV